MHQIYEILLSTSFISHIESQNILTTKPIFYVITHANSPIRAVDYYSLTYNQPLKTNYNNTALTNISNINTILISTNKQLIKTTDKQL